MTQDDHKLTGLALGELSKEDARALEESLDAAHRDELEELRSLNQLLKQELPKERFPGLTREQLGSLRDRTVGAKIHWWNLKRLIPILSLPVVAALALVIVQKGPEADTSRLLLQNEPMELADRKPGQPPALRELKAPEDAGMRDADAPSAKAKPDAPKKPHLSGIAEQPKASRAPREALQRSKSKVEAPAPKKGRSERDQNSRAEPVAAKRKTTPPDAAADTEASYGKLADTGRGRRDLQPAGGSAAPSTGSLGLVPPPVTFAFLQTKPSDAKIKPTIEAVIAKNLPSLDVCRRLFVDKSSLMLTVAARPGHSVKVNLKDELQNASADAERCVAAQVSTWTFPVEAPTTLQFRLRL